MQRISCLQKWHKTFNYNHCLVINLVTTVARHIYNASAAYKGKALQMYRI